MLVYMSYPNDAVFGEDCNKKTHFVTIMRYYYVSNKNGKQDGPYDESTLFFFGKKSYIFTRLLHMVRGDARLVAFSSGVSAEESSS